MSEVMMILSTVSKANGISAREVANITGIEVERVRTRVSLMVRKRFLEQVPDSRPLKLCITEFGLAKLRTPAKTPMVKTREMVQAAILKRSALSTCWAPS